MEPNNLQPRNAIKIFTAVVFCFAIMEGFSINIFSNYLVDAFNVSDEVRGLIETPRELPGILGMFILSALVMYADVSLAIMAQALCVIGLLVMGTLSPNFEVMILFMFIYSLGSHLYFPLEASMLMSLSEEGKMGATMGKVKAVSTFGYFISAIAVFFGFRSGLFDFTTPVKMPFVLGALSCATAAVLLWTLRRNLSGMQRREKSKLLFKKEYMPYYMITFAYGCQKRIRLVFGLWVFVKLLGYKADFTALLLIASAAVGMFLSPQFGKLLDILGLRKAMFFEGMYMIFMFGIFGFFARSFSQGVVPPSPILLGATILIFIGSDATRFFEMFHAYTMRCIAERPGDITPSLSVGQAVDHVMAMSISPVFGIVWAVWGPQWVFWLAGASALVQLYVGTRFPKQCVSEN
ncbi:MAG: MFS transporter [Eubacteriales bacterium]|nr:MFS transporter [Eubacteriales bacterium]NLV69689.1 MFS transporter [Clostridiales bacterium]